MNEMKIYENKEFGKLRAVEINGEPWLVGKDVAVVLGYSNPRDALSKHVDEEDKGVAKCDTLGGAQNLTIINESGLYSLVLSSKLPGAKKFKRWVKSEFLKSTHKHNKENAQMNEITIYENKEFGRIRAIELDGEPWLVGKDVATALGYAKPENAISAHVDTEDKTTTLIQGTGSNYKSKAVIVNESGLYSLILSSKLPNAKKFKHWVTSEVLPSIRKHGGYIAGQESMSDEELLARALLMAQSKIEERDRKIAELSAKAELDAPKVAFAEAVNDTKTNITVEKFAKLLYDEHNIQLGRNKMFKLLRDMGYLRDNNMPYQKYLESGYFTTCEVLRNGHPYVVTLITGKGQTKLFQKIANVS